MEAYATIVTNYLLRQSWQIALLVLVVALATRILSSRSAHLRYLLWLLVLAKCLVPPVFAVALPILPKSEPRAPDARQPARPDMVPSTMNAEFAPPPIAETEDAGTGQGPEATRLMPDLSLREGLAVIWLGGGAAFAAMALRKAWRTQRWLRAERHELGAELQGCVHDVFARLAVKRPPKVWSLDGVSQPFVWGLLRGDIYLPPAFGDVVDDEQRRDVLGHELSHVLRFDAAVNTLQILGQAVFWFHPFVWWANKRIRVEREKCCDESTIARLGAGPKHYSRAILETLRTEHQAARPIPSLAVAEPVKNLEERIRTMLRPGKQFYRRPSTVGVILILMAAMATIPTTLAFSERHSNAATQDEGEDPLKILDVKFDPIHQGKNVVRVRVQNTTDEGQVFRLQIYTRSPDYGRRGVGWGTSFFDRLEPKETKWTRFVFKIQGPITDATYVRLDFHHPGPAAGFDLTTWYHDKRQHKPWFKRVTYTSSELERQEPDTVRAQPASPEQTRAVTEVFRTVQSCLRAGQYERVWQLFTRDYREAEYQIPVNAFERFQKTMEPTHPTESAFRWEKEAFLKLQPKTVLEHNGVLTLTAAEGAQRWTIHFVRQDGQWKIDWIGGYVPRILREQEQSERAVPAGRSSNLKVLEVQFDPLQQGKNVLRIQVQNLAEQDQIFGVSVQARSPRVGGWGTTFVDAIEAGRTRWTRCAFTLRGPVADNSEVELSFYNPGPATGFDAEKWFATRPWDQWFSQRSHTGRELPRKETVPARLSPAPQEESRAVFDAFRTIQDHVGQGKYENAWDCFTRDYRDAGFFRKYPSFKEYMEEIKGPNRFSWLRKEFVKLTPESVAARDGTLVLTAALEQQKWTIDFVQEDGRWKMDWVAGFVSGWERKARWQEYVLPKMGKRSTAHFDIYYPKDSTAAREIEQIAQHRDKGFTEICRFLGRDSDVRIRMVLFEDGRTKQEATGHQGAGWAFGNTIVEVYNEQEKLDPYHETVHILMGPFGNPPALFNEGFAVYMSERLGAHALESLGGGQATIRQRAGELKDRGEWIELEELLGYTEIGSRATRPPVSYAEAASFVKFLIDTYGKDKFLQAYRTLRNSNDKAVQQENTRKLSQIYGQTLEALERQWHDTLSES